MKLTNKTVMMLVACVSINIFFVALLAFERLYLTPKTENEARVGCTWYLCNYAPDRDKCLATCVANLTTWSYTSTMLMMRFSVIVIFTVFSILLYIFHRMELTIKQATNPVIVAPISSRILDYLPTETIQSYVDSKSVLKKD